MNVTRQRNGKHVMFKRIYPDKGQHELMVMPLLRPFNVPHFQTFDECGIFTQIYEVRSFQCTPSRTNSSSD